MPFYSALPAARARQILADVLALAGVVLSIALGAAVGGLIAGLAEVGRRIEAAGTGFGSAMSEAGGALGDLPLVGDAVRSPFDGAGDAGSALAAAGRDQQELVAVLAVVVGVVVAALPILVIALVWLRPRLRFARRARTLGRLAALPGGEDLLALRALADLPAGQVLAVHPRAVAAWRAGDEAVVAALADLALSSAGIGRRPASR